MNNNFYGNKEDIIKCLNARLTGYGMQEANQYFINILQHKFKIIIILLS